MVEAQMNNFIGQTVGDQCFDGNFVFKVNLGFFIAFFLSRYPYSWFKLARFIVFYLVS